MDRNFINNECDVQRVSKLYSSILGMSEDLRIKYLTVG